MNIPLYTTEILRLASSLSEPREIPRIDGYAEARSPSCGSRVTTAVQLDAGRRVAALSQTVHACAFGQASSALVERGAIGRSREELDAALKELRAWLGGDGIEPAWPGLTDLAPARESKSRHAAILLPFRALLAAMEAAR